MGDMLLRGVPDAIKAELTDLAKQDGQSLSEKAIQILRRGMLVEREDRTKPPKSAWKMLRSAAVETGAIDDEGEFGKIMDEIEAERKRDFGRPISDFE